MNWDRIQGEWKQLTSNVKTKWAKLTDEDLTLIGAKKDELVGRIQERYGVLRDEAEKQVDEWISKLPVRRESKAPPSKSDPSRDSAETAKH